MTLLLENALTGGAALTGVAGPRAVLGSRSVGARDTAAGAGTSDPDRRAELGDGLAQRGDRQRDADGEHDTRSRQGRAKQPVPPVPLLRRVTVAPERGLKLPVPESAITVTINVCG